MEKKFADQDETPLSRQTAFFVVLVVLVVVIGIFTFLFRILSFDIPQGKVHINKYPLLHSRSF